MKKRLFLLFLACAFTITIFTGCNYKLKNEGWAEEIYSYVLDIESNPSGMKNIDCAHKEAFESAFNDIELFGARLCVPMKVSELPDKFELSGSYSEYVPLSEEKAKGNDIGAGLINLHNMHLYYDREVKVAKASVICKEGQSLGEGIIYELEFGLFNVQPVLLGGQVDINSDIDEIKGFLGEGNEFYSFNLFDLRYTDGNRLVELTYGIQGDDTNFFMGSIRTYNNYFY